MNASKEAIERAVLRIFREMDRLHPKGRVLLANAERRWRATGFRRSDLFDALDRLESSGCVRLEDNAAQGVDIVLLSPGFRLIALVPITPGALWRTLRSTLALLRAAYRKPSLRWKREFRRLSDRSSGSEGRGSRAARIALEGHVSTARSPADGAHAHGARGTDG